MTDTADDFLAHYGILGMKWGHRKAGVSTGPSNASTVSIKPKPAMSVDARTAHKTADQIQEKGLDSLTNKQLQAYVNRINLEQNYARLTTQPKKINAGKKWASDLVANTTKSVAQQYLTNALKKGLDLGLKAATDKFVK
jgi:hypothetical protein